MAGLHQGSLERFIRMERVVWSSAYGGAPSVFRFLCLLFPSWLPCKNVRKITAGIRTVLVWNCVACLVLKSSAWRFGSFVQLEIAWWQWPSGHGRTEGGEVKFLSIVFWWYGYEQAWLPSCPPWKLTWNMKLGVWKMHFPFHRDDFQVPAVSFQRCIFWHCIYPDDHCQLKFDQPKWTPRCVKGMAIRQYPDEELSLHRNLGCKQR